MKKIIARIVKDVEKLEPSYTADRGLPQWLSNKESSCNVGDAEDVGSVPGVGRSPWRKKWQPTLVFLPGGYHQRSLVVYSP